MTQSVRKNFGVSIAYSSRINVFIEFYHLMKKELT